MNDTTELQNAITNARRYCHGPDCTNFKECPKTCGCKGRGLDLSTAIVWKAADIAEFIYSNLSDYSRATAAEKAQHINTLLSALVLHYISYPIATGLVEELSIQVNIAIEQFRYSIHTDRG
jgi:hypothetical protein